MGEKSIKRSEAVHGGNNVSCNEKIMAMQFWRGTQQGYEFGFHIIMSIWYHHGDMLIRLAGKKR